MPERRGVRVCCGAPRQDPRRRLGLEPLPREGGRARRGRAGAAHDRRQRGHRRSQARRGRAAGCGTARKGALRDEIEVRLDRFARVPHAPRNHAVVSRIARALLRELEPGREAQPPADHPGRRKTHERNDRRRAHLGPRGVGRAQAEPRPDESARALRQGGVGIPHRARQAAHHHPGRPLRPARCDAGREAAAAHPQQPPLERGEILSPGERSHSFAQPARRAGDDRDSGPGNRDTSGRPAADVRELSSGFERREPPRYGPGSCDREEGGGASRRRHQPYERRRLRNPVHGYDPPAADRTAGRGELMADEPKRKVLVIEDEPSIRNNIMLMLKVERYAATGAENGRVGLEMARSDPPDLILCDVMMPEMDGFAVLEALRAEPRLAEIPFIFLTALDDRSSTRRGMNLGADDYLPKPFTRNELMEAVNSRLKKFENLTQALAARLVPQQDRLTQKFREKIAGGDGTAALEDADPGGLTGRIAEASVLFSDIRNFTTYSERLTSDEIAELLNAYLQTACAPIIRCRGVVMKFIGDGVMALFESIQNEEGESHAHRAVRAGLAMQLAALEFREWVKQHHPSQSLPEFSIGVGIHSGEVMLCHVGTPGRGELTVIGDTVNIASRLEGQTKELGWAVVASEATVNATSPAIVVGLRRKVHLRGRSMPTDAFEIIGIAARDADQASVQIPEDMRQALAASSRIAADAAKAALGITLSIITGEIGQKRLTIQGYRVVSKVGRGGSSIVYLAERESDKQQVVLKILNATAGLDEILLQRFVQEFDIISSIDHPNVVKIYDRGFSDRHAYIAMEYFPNGSLAEVIAQGLSGRQALSLLAQGPSALREVHNRGIIHRDIKPGNLMARADGSIVLADFGIAKRLGEDKGRTLQGELYGTPYYVSPEQIEGSPATMQSDIYALGLIFYEMLTRQRPFDAESVSGLIALHVSAPRPKLPDEFADYQGLLDRMIAVDPRNRFKRADEVLEAIDEVWTQQALRALKQGS